MIDTVYMRFEGEKCPKCGTFGEEEEDHLKCPACGTEFNKYVVLKDGEKIKMDNN